MAVLAAAIALTGCRTTEYERIELSGIPQSTADPGIVIEQDGDMKGEEESMLKLPGVTEAPETDTEAVTEEEADAGADVPMDTAGKNTLLFGGDVLLSSHVLSAYQKAGGISGVLDEGYRSVIWDAGFFMVNEEFPFSSRGIQAADKEYTFRLEPERVSIFREMGIDAVTLANNHALDFGEDALLDSVATLDGAGILHTGAGADLSEARKPVVTVLDGQETAVIGATRVVPESSWAAGKNHAGMLSSYDATALLEEVRAQKESGKFVIVYVHWGVEKDEKPQEYQRTLGQQYINAGADLVIGAHPHVLQGIEYYKGKPIVYSLGNFVFGSTIPRTMLLEVKLEKDGGGQSAVHLRLIPGTSGAGYTRMLTDSAKLQEFYRYIESISFGVTLMEDGSVIPQQ